MGLRYVYRARITFEERWMGVKVCVSGHQRMLSNNPHWKSFIVKQQKAKRLFNVKFAHSINFASVFHTCLTLSGVSAGRNQVVFQVTPGNVDGFLRNWMWAYFVRNKKNGKVMKYRPEAAEFLAGDTGNLRSCFSLPQLLTDEHLKKGAAGSASAADILQKSEGGAFKLSASEITAL